MKSVTDIAKSAREAYLELAASGSSKKNKFLESLERILGERTEEILKANRSDLEKAKKEGLSAPMLERLSLSPDRIAKIAEGVRQVRELPDPVGEIMEETERPNGLKIEKTRTPIGVVGIIYESRPNVTVDCAILCVKSGNACILRGGHEAFESNSALAKCLREALCEAKLPEDCVQILPSSDRALMGEMLKLDKYIDCIIPRGGEKLIRYVVENSTVPVLKHYKGVCSVYVDKDADEKLSEIISVDSKCQRPSVCNAAENLLIHKDAAKKLLPKIGKMLSERGVELRASSSAKAVLIPAGIPCSDASEEDFSTEYTDLIISIEVVDSIDEAIKFINKYGSGHSDCIITSDTASAEKFLNGVDSAAVYWNASTRFTDGFEFGLGAEIGISTDKLHARGPMGLRELCSYKYKIRGNGQTRGKPVL